MQWEHSIFIEPDFARLGQALNDLGASGFEAVSVSLVPAPPIPVRLEDGTMAEQPGPLVWFALLKRPRA
jgi:hypothetical protein